MARIASKLRRLVPVHETRSAFRGSVDRPDQRELWRALPNVFEGWALEGRDSPTAVEIVVNGDNRFSARTGLPRPDVGVNIGEPEAATDCGWSIAVDLATCSGPEVRIQVVVTGRTGDRYTLMDRTFRLRSDDFAGHLDAPMEGAVISGDVVAVRGWAMSGDRLPSRVEIEIDGRAAGRARLRVPRSDVEALSPERVGPFAGFEYFEPVDAPLTKASKVAVTVTAADGTQIRMAERSVRGEPRTLSREEAEAQSSRRAQTDRAVRLAFASPTGAESAGEHRLLVFTHQLSLGGGQLYLQELLRRLLPVLASCTVVSPSDGVLRSELERLGVDVVVTGTPAPNDPITYEGQVRELSMLIRGSNCDLVLVNTLTELPAADAAERLGIPTIWAVHESYAIEVWLSIFYGSRGWHPYIAERLKTSLSGATRLVFEAQTTSDMFAPYAQPAQRLVVPYGVDVERIEAYAKSFDKRSARQRHNLPDDATVLLSVGIVEERKSQPCLVEAFVEVAAAHADAVLVIIGDSPGPYSAAFHRQINATGMGERIRLLPITPDIWEWYALSDVLLSASDIESLPRSMLEAMTLGIPTLSASVFGIPELIEEGETGWMFAPRDIRALADAMNRVLQLSPEARARVGQSARSMVKQRQLSADYGRSYMELMRTVISETDGDANRSQQGSAASESPPPPTDPLPLDVDAPTRSTYEAVRPFTMTSPQRVVALCEAVRYISHHHIPGDVVECGVWRGGSMLAIARTLLESADTERTLWLYDTFTGMSEPADVDRRIYDHAPAADLLAAYDRTADVWGVSGLAEVKQTMSRCEYPASRIRFVVGKVEETIPADAPARIALLRLDTDWYESTHHELAHLLPRVSPGGILIIDDYGDWEGARRAVDEYLAATNARILLSRIDHTGRIAVVPG